jgi:hypothetical protein
MSEANQNQTRNNQSEPTQQVSTQQPSTAATTVKPTESYADFVGISIILLIFSILWLRKHK